MPFAFSPFRKANPGWLMVLAALAVGFAAPARADVQTYTNQAIPVLPPAGAGYYDTPLKAGQLTMQEVLETHPKTKPPSAPPLLSAPANSSAESIMLMQGMQNALQEAPPAGAIPRLRAPHMNGAIAGEPAVPPIEESQLFGNAATAAPTPLEPGVKYQPGQAPKNLAGEIQKTENAAIPEATALQSQPAPLAASSAGTSSSATAAAGGCEAHIQNWDKSCAEAGYPATYVGKVVGETRTECPSGTLQDVWVQNTCMPPENGPAVAATAEAMTKAQLAASAPPAHASSASEVSPSAMASASAAAAPPIPAALAAPPTAAAPITREDGNCGSANGLASIVKPFGDLCMAGQPTPVTGAGPWRWSCQGMAGGMTVSCAAPLSSQSAAAAAATTGNPAMTASPVPSPTPEDGRCGAANDTGSVQAPAAELCAGGIASAVSGAGPWTWACSGLNGGQAAACRAPRIVSGACGTAISQATDHMPAADLCAEGYAGAVTGQGPWNWTCSGLYGGPAAVCSVAPKKDAVCGTASLSGHHQAPINDLCSIGEASAVTGSGPWTWGCAGVNGGAAVSCTADASLNGMCGAANGVAAGEAPRGDLCAEGKPTRVTGAGPWSWNCEGVAGGETQGCVAPMAVPEPTLKSSPSAQPVVGSAPVGHAEQNTTSSAELSSVPPSMAPAAAPKPAAKTEITWNKPAAAPQETTVACGIASEAVAFVAPSKNLCRKGAAGDVTGKGPWKWACTDKDGYAVDCATLGPSNGTCGAAGDVASAREPASGLCAAGSAGSVTAGKDMWTWTCAGTLGGTSAYCMAPMTAAMKSAAPAKKAAKTSSPSSHTAVLSGPPPVAAPQAKPAPPPITHPACGDAAGRGALSAPRHEDLCAVGEASHVKGRGPWHWTCYRHRAHVACEAPRQMDGACGSANGATLKVAPFRHLCRSGKPTEVAGAGPWLWSCVGEGGGNSASCSALSQAQTRVEGACGAAANTPVHNAPSVNLCDSGVASAVNGGGPWTWTCSGLNGGYAATCTAQKAAVPAPPPPGPMVNGLCGSANGVPDVSPPAHSLCAAGTVTPLSGEGPWNWNCLGENGGMTVSCTAPLQPPAPVVGACGGASGVPTLVAPQSGLCAAGIASAVSGAGPWTWSCSGINGGGAVGCVGPLAESGGTGSLPSPVTPSGVASLPQQIAPPMPIEGGGLVTPQLPAGPLPPLESGSLPPPPGAALEPVPQSAPGLPSDANPLLPPPIRDNNPPPRALRPPAINSQGQMIPGNHFVIPAELSSLPFATGSENIGRDDLPTLHKLVQLLRNHGGVRVTLTAYAALGQSTSPRDARRLSLARALAVRDYLTAKGISSARINVRAMGANVESGDMDRVDISAN